MPLAYALVWRVTRHDYVSLDEHRLYHNDYRGSCYYDLVCDLEPVPGLTVPGRR